MPVSPLPFSFDFRPPFFAVVWLAFSPLSVLLLYFPLVSGLCVGARVNRPALLIGLLCLCLVRRLWFGLGVFP